MKFSVLHKDCAEVLAYAEEVMGKKYGNGASLDRIARVGIRNMAGEAVRSGLAFECTGSVLSYIYHKVNFDWLNHACTVVRGWFG